MQQKHGLCLEFMVKHVYIVTELDLLQTSSKENQNESKKKKKQGLMNSNVILKCEEHWV